VCFYVVVKRGERTGTKNVVLTLFTCVVFALSWVCPRDRLLNTSILHATDSCDLITIIRDQRLWWAGYVCRMEDNRLPKQVLYSELPNSPWPTGRPNPRLRDMLKRNLNAFSITDTSWENSPGTRKSEVCHWNRKRNGRKIIPGGLWALPCLSSRTTA